MGCLMQQAIVETIPYDNEFRLFHTITAMDMDGGSSYLVCGELLLVHVHVYVYQTCKLYLPCACMSQGMPFNDWVGAPCMSPRRASPCHL